MDSIPVTSPSRPQHRRNPSSKSNILKALVFPRGRVEATEAGSSSETHAARVDNGPSLPLDHPRSTKQKVLGDRQANISSSPASPSKSRQKVLPNSKTSGDLRPSVSTLTQNSRDALKKSKSSTNLSSVFAKMNRSGKDLCTSTALKGKENTTPPTSSAGEPPTPIWAHFATTASQPPWTDAKAGKTQRVEDEIDKYTPREYSPSKQRNFGGDLNKPQIKPRLATRPKSLYIPTSADSGTVEKGRASIEIARPSTSQRETKPVDRGESLPRRERIITTPHAERNVSGSSAEQAPPVATLDVKKRGAKATEAVTKLQGDTNGANTFEQPTTAILDANAIDQAFEAMLVSRNVPEATKQKMRSMTLNLKMVFVRQDQEAAHRSAGATPPKISAGNESRKPISLPHGSAGETQSVQGTQEDDDEGQGTKRSRPRSRTFTFSKSSKQTEPASPGKRHRSRSRGRGTHDETSFAISPIKSKSPRGSTERNIALPTDYISYLRAGQNPIHVEVGRVHKLRILLRNETVAWVDNFISQGGMAEIVALIHRILHMEWREDHEDCLLAETLLCLKGLCTTERAMDELEKVADGLFPALIGMLFDDEKKGPAEYTTRMTIMTVLFSFLESATHFSSEAREQRARRILAYLSEAHKSEDKQPIEFVLDMHTPRPYKLWCREVTHVTKEVFWIFLHHFNVVPVPNDDLERNAVPAIERDPEERKKVLAATYTQRHFPGSRPPVPAAPYIGGVEWDATLYLTSHLDLINGLVTSLPTVAARNRLRTQLQASGFEKVFGATLRTCKEKFYCHIHDGLRAWVAAAAEDDWDTLYVREGPTQEEQARSYSPRKSPTKRIEKPPKLDDVPKLDLDLGGLASKKSLPNIMGATSHDNAKINDDGWLE